MIEIRYNQEWKGQLVEIGMSHQNMVEYPKRTQLGVLPVLGKH